MLLGVCSLWALARALKRVSMCFFVRARIAAHPLGSWHLTHIAVLVDDAVVGGQTYLPLSGVLRIAACCAGCQHCVCSTFVAIVVTGSATGVCDN